MPSTSNIAGDHKSSYNSHRTGLFSAVVIPLEDDVCFTIDKTDGGLNLDHVRRLLVLGPARVPKFLSEFKNISLRSLSLDLSNI